MMKFFTKYNPPVSPSVSFSGDPGFTDQSQKDSCDINKIIDRYRETGYLVDPMHPGVRKPMFGDFTFCQDYQECLELINRADDAFMNLPSKVRERFHNNPKEIFDFLNDEKNRSEAIELGLIESPVHTVRETVSDEVKSDEVKS